MLTIHHLGRSQSERIIWLAEELGLPYEIKHYVRHPTTILAPPELDALHPMGAAPVITEGPLMLAESAAIVEYLLAKHGNGRLAAGLDDPGFAEYLYWFHFSNGNLQPVLGRCMILSRLSLPPGNPVQRAVQGRLDRVLKVIETRLATHEYLAGPFTAADIMSVFSLTTMRLFFPVDLSPYPNILAYLARIGARPAYRRAMAAGDPGFVPMLT